MGWIRVLPREHECGEPITFNKGAGSIWQCDTCHQYWKLRRWRIGSYGYHEWDKIEPPAVIVQENKKPLLEILGLK